jgi:hypothetical protein
MNYNKYDLLFFSTKIYTTPELKYQRNIINFFGVFVLIFAIIVLYLAGNPGYQRPPDNEIEHIPLAD